MAVSLPNGLRVAGSYDLGLETKDRVVGHSEVLAWKNEFTEKNIVLKEESSSDGWNPKIHSNSPIHAQTSICVPRGMRWWDNITTNMREIKSAQDLVDSLLNAGDKLVIVDFYSPGCGGCRALHPKICQLAESNADALFLKVNYEGLKSMCHSLHIHVLPLFRFYRGAQGRVSSFSCTNATIKKFKDALAKHGADRCSLGPAKGLEESELMNLASDHEIQFSYPLKKNKSDDLVLSRMR